MSTENVIELSTKLNAALAQPTPRRRIKVAPGIYPRDQYEYFAVDAVNFSTLKELAASPKRYRHRLSNPKKATTPMRLGTAAHTAVLEPDRFMTDYAMYTGERRAGKAWKDFEAANAGKEIVKRDEYMRAMAIRDAVRSDAVAGKYLQDIAVEQTLVWEDQETGTLCKARLDIIGAEALADLKSAAAIEEFRFCATAANLSYHVQCAFYHDGYEALTGHDMPFKVIAVEPEAPHDVVVYNVPEHVLDVGRDEYRSLLVRLKECQRTGNWHGYADGAERELQLPKWKLADGNDLTELGLEL